MDIPTVTIQVSPVPVAFTSTEVTLPDASDSTGGASTLDKVRLVINVGRLVERVPDAVHDWIDWLS